MTIRIACSAPGYEDCWIEYRDEPWPFGDRRKMLASSNDLDTLQIILSYASAWNLRNVDGSVIPFSRELVALDQVDDLAIIPWLILSWFQARAERAVLPKAPSAPSTTS